MSKFTPKRFLGLTQFVPVSLFILLIKLALIISSMNLIFPKILNVDEMTCTKVIRFRLLTKVI
jgi:hypothetical protein